MTYNDVDDHEPGPVDSEGHFRCSACGFRAPCPTVRAQPRRLDQDEIEVLRALDIGIGFTIEQRQPEGAEAKPIRGTVVGAWEDQDGRRTFRVVDFPQGRRRIHVMRLDEVEPARVALPNAAICRSQARKLADAVGRQKGIADGEEIEVLADAITLFQAIA